MFLDPRERTFAVGVWVASFSAGGALGPLLGGLLLEHFWVGLCVSRERARHAAVAGRRATAPPRNTVIRILAIWIRSALRCPSLLSSR
jgi:MFS family permease